MDLSHPSTKLIIAECRANDLLRNQCAYVLATAWHETGRYKFMREIWGPTPVQQRYEGRKDLGNTKKGDGKKFMGRGFVQITGRRNYADWSDRLGIDLLKDPTLAEKPAIAVKIIVRGMKLGTFTGKKLSDYITLQKSDFRGSRRIVNGLDRADDIADYAEDFDDLLTAEGYGIAEVETKPDTVTVIETDKKGDQTVTTVPTKPETPILDKKPNRHGIGALLAIIAAVGAAIYQYFFGG